MDASELTFVVVEDHEFQRNVLVKMLKGLNAKAVHAAGDGRAALDLLKSLSTQVDVIVSDLDMPTMDGMALVRHIALGHYATSLIITSSLERGLLSSVETMASAYGINLLGTIEKPVTPRKLEELIQMHRAIDKRTVAREKPTATYAYTPEEVLEGLENGEFEPYYQPKVDIATGRVVGAEALARWKHPQLGIVSPAAFVAPLERAGKIDMLMRCMLRKSAEYCRELRDAGYAHTIAVNLSVKSLNSVGVADQITETVRQQRVEPRLIVLEVTESAAATDIGKVLENLARLRMKGFQLSIDDYGTGYSSLEQLSRIPFSELKIDQSFVTHAIRQEPARVILASSLDMARRLSIRAVAEGVETRLNWDLLVDLNCDIAQGYYISRPLAQSAYGEWLKAWDKMRGAAEPRASSQVA